MNVLLGVDLGTSTFKAAAIAVGGRILASGRREVNYDRPGPDQVEFSAAARFQQLCDLIREVASALPPDANPVALGLSGASGNTLLLDGRHRPLGPAISWLDTRPGDDFPALLPSLAREEVRAIVGWPWSKRFPLSQLAWIRRHQPGVYRKVRYVALDTAYYYRELTGRLVIDHSSATTFFLQDQRRRRWHRPFLAALDLKPSALPDLVAPGTPIGGLTRQAARVVGLPAGLPVVAGSFDHPSAALGSGVLQPGELLLSCGTSWVGFLPTNDRAAALAGGLIVDPFLQPAGPWGAMFSLTAVGTVVDRYLTTVFPLPRALSLAERYQRFVAAAGTVVCGQEGPPIDPLLPLPENRAAKARLVGDSSLGQLSRRLMVGVALALRRRLAAVTRTGFKTSRITMVGGPTSSPVWTQIVADVLDRELFIAGGPNAGAVGAALLGGIGTGQFRNATQAAVGVRRASTSIAPDPATRAWYDQFNWQ